MSSSNRQDLIIGLLCAFLVMLIWSAFQILSRHAMVGTLSPFDMVALRFGVGGLLVIPILIRLGWPKVALTRSLVLVATAGLGFSVLAYTGFIFAPAAHGGLILPGSLPIWTAVLGWLWLSETVQPSRLLAIGIIIFGIALVGSASFQGNHPGAWRGDLLFVAASIMWSIFTVSIRAWQISAIQATCVICLLSALIYLPVYFLFLPHAILQTPLWELGMQGAFQGGSIVVTLWAFTKAVSLLGPVAASMVTAFVPVVTALAAIPILGESLSLLAIGGIIMASMGMIGAVLSLRLALKDNELNAK